MKDGWQDKALAVLKRYPSVEVLDPRSWANLCPNAYEYTRRDLNAIASCDAVLAYMDSSNPSGFGMSLEIGYAYAKEKHVFFVDAISQDWRSRYFDMVRTVSDSTHFSVEDAARKIGELS